MVFSSLSQKPWVLITSDDRRVGNLELETTSCGKQARQSGLTEQNITISKDVQSER